MAIVKMKRLRVAAMAQEREELLRALLRLGCVEISEPDHLADGWPDFLRRSGSALAETKGEAADAASALDALRRFAQTKDGLFIQRRPVKESDFLSADAARRAKEACGRINGLTAKLTTLDAERERLTAVRGQLCTEAAALLRAARQRHQREEELYGSAMDWAVADALIEEVCRFLA